MLDRARPWKGLALVRYRKSDAQRDLVVTNGPVRDVPFRLQHLKPPHLPNGLDARVMAFWIVLDD